METGFNGGVVLSTLNFIVVYLLDWNFGKISQN